MASITRLDRIRSQAVALRHIVLMGKSLNSVQRYAADSLIAAATTVDDARYMLAALESQHAYDDQVLVLQDARQPVLPVLWQLQAELRTATTCLRFVLMASGQPISIARQRGSFEPVAMARDRKYIQPLCANYEDRHIASYLVDTRDWSLAPVWQAA